MAIKTVLDENFEEVVLKSEKAVLLDFWAPWCGYCKRLNPVMDVVDEEYQDKIQVCKVNIDESQGLAQKYKIMTIPSLLVFKDGELVDTIVAPKSKADLDKWLKDNNII